MAIKLRGRMVGARVTDKEFELIAKQARLRGQRKSVFIREMLLTHIALYSTEKNK